ncbi:MAG: hypothetical protein PUI10_01520, partial [Prevotellaceae bacterium]|nr:hypothetical protein [Prevotellaceae bacterium]
FYSRRSTFHFTSPAPPPASEHKNGDVVLEMPENVGAQTPKAHKNLDFVLEMPENRGSKAKKRTKMAILCSKTLKTGLPKAKSAQKPRFCARKP